MRIILFADIHIGAISDINYVYDTMTSFIDQEIIFKEADAVIILGDYFHRLFKANEDYISLAINIMSYLIRACIRNHTKIRMIYGTESHEMSQYRLFNYHMTSTKVDIKLFNTVTEEELFPGVHVLYLPEEYVLDKKEHYKDTLYSGKHYQYIFGHGTIEEGVPPMMAAGGKNIENSSGNKEKIVPHFKNKELSTISDLCVFGHYHCYTEIGDNVFYLGSLFRNIFGEETPKGYGVVEGSTLTFVENTNAYIFKSYTYKRDDPIYQSPDQIMEAINHIKEENSEVFEGKSKGRFRMVLIAPDNLEDSWKDTLRSILRNERFITYLLKEPLMEVKEEIEEEYGDEFDFIIDHGLELPEKVFRYISMTRPESTLTFKEVEDYINKAMK